MPTKNSINGIHAQRLKRIRPFINFNYDLRKPLTPYQKRRIKEYWDEIDALTARPYMEYRPRNKERLRQAQEFAQHEKQLPGLKVAFIPTAGDIKPKIRFNKKGELIATTEYVTTRFIKFDPVKLVKDAKKHCEDKIKEAPGAKRFTILAGRYEIPASYSKELVAENVAKLAEKYGNPDANNYFNNWMIGLNAHSFKKQSDFTEYKAEKARARKALQRKRKNKKRAKDRKARK